MATISIITLSADVVAFHLCSVCALMQLKVIRCMKNILFMDKTTETLRLRNVLLRFL